MTRAGGWPGSTSPRWPPPPPPPPRLGSALPQPASPILKSPPPPLPPVPLAPPFLVQIWLMFYYYLSLAEPVSALQHNFGFRPQHCTVILVHYDFLYIDLNCDMMLELNYAD